MEGYGRQIVVDMPIEAVLKELTIALNGENFTILSRVNVRDYVDRTLHADFRKYVLLEAAIPRMLRDALKEDLRTGVILPTTIAVYELADGETAVVVAEPFANLASHPERRHWAPRLATLADETCARLAAAIETLEEGARAYASLPPDVQAQIP